MTATQEQLAALAALVGITPETHPHLFAHQCIACKEWGNTHLGNMFCFDDRRCCDDAPDNRVFIFIGRAIDTDACDDVFLAPFIRWLRNSGRWHFVHLHVLCGSLVSEGGIFTAQLSRNTTYDTCGITATLALLRACQSAGVPEIVEIFGRGDHDAR